MQSMNSVVLVGRLTAAPELTAVGENSTSKIRVTLAVNSTRSKDAPADFINIEAWGKTAESMSQYLNKGSLIGVTGELHTSSYESTKLFDEQGNPGTIYSSYVTVESFTFLEAKKDQSEAPQESQEPPARSTTRPAVRTATNKPAAVAPRNQATAGKPVSGAPPVAWGNKGGRAATGTRTR